MKVLTPLVLGAMANALSVDAQSTGFHAPSVALDSDLNEQLPFSLGNDNGGFYPSKLDSFEDQPKITWSFTPNFLDRQQEDEEDLNDHDQNDHDHSQPFRHFAFHSKPISIFKLEDELAYPNKPNIQSLIKATMGKFVNMLRKEPETETKENNESEITESNEPHLHVQIIPIAAEIEIDDDKIENFNSFESDGSEGLEPFSSSETQHENEGVTITDVTLTKDKTHSTLKKTILTTSGPTTENPNRPKVTHFHSVVIQKPLKGTEEANITRRQNILKKIAHILSPFGHGN